MDSRGVPNECCWCKLDQIHNYFALSNSLALLSIQRQPVTSDAIAPVQTTVARAKQEKHRSLHVGSHKIGSQLAVR